MPGMGKGENLETLAHLKRQHVSLDSVLLSSGHIAKAINVPVLPLITSDFARCERILIRV